jgi:hypothetical protein
MSAVLRCHCDDCGGATYTKVAEYFDAHPGEHSFEVELIDSAGNAHPYRATPKTAQLMFDWEGPL